MTRLCIINLTNDGFGALLIKKILQNIKKNLSKTMATLYISRERDAIWCWKRAGTTFVLIVDENGVGPSRVENLPNLVRILRSTGEDSKVLDRYSCRTGPVPYVYGFHPDVPGQWFHPVLVCDRCDRSPSLLQWLHRTATGVNCTVSRARSSRWLANNANFEYCFKQ